MNRRLFLTRALPATSATLLLPELAGCGSIFFPERMGQPRMGPLDWKVVALDGIGLLLFFVPGVVAFVVDFYNGTLFLPTYGPMPQEQYVPPPQPGENILPPPQPAGSYSPPPPPATPLWPTPASLSPGSLNPGAPAPSGALQALPPPPAQPGPQQSGAQQRGAQSSGVQQPLGANRSSREAARWSRSDFEAIDVPRHELTRAGIERVVSKRIGRPVSLAHESARVTSLSDLSEFHEQIRGLAAGRIEGLPPQRAFGRS